MEEDVKALHKARASKRKYHFIYKTTCLVTGRWYIGMHSTDVLEDGYLGSGKRLWYSIEKHGVENHVREVLEFCSDRQALSDREKEIVNAELLKEEQCMNLKEGGETFGGGFWNDEQAKKFWQAGQKAMMKNKNHHDASKKSYATKVLRDVSGKKEFLRTFHEAGRIAAASVEANEKRKATMRRNKSNCGEKNAMFGKKFACINKGDIRKRVPFDMLQDYLSDGWSKGWQSYK